MEESLTDEQKEELEQLGINKNSEGVPNDVTSDDLVGLQTRKKECQFAKYGFEKPEFNCEILGEVDNKLLIGYYVEEYPRVKEPQKIPCFFLKKTGNCYKGAGISNSKYNLKPLKKEWYEDKSSRFKLFVLNDDSFKILHWWYKDKKELDCIDVKTGNKQTISVEKTRLATKKEVLSLYKESK